MHGPELVLEASWVRLTIVPRDTVARSRTKVKIGIFRSSQSARKDLFVETKSCIKMISFNDLARTVKVLSSVIEAFFHGTVSRAPRPLSGNSPRDYSLGDQR